ncbi:MAG: hypothetical protein WC205_18875 [Opitutaceae bacterium]|jgi:hypothetical protein
MNPEAPVHFYKNSYRGIVTFQLKWVEGGVDKGKSFETEAEAVVEMGEIEERLRIAKMAGQGFTVNPFGMHTPYITSKDVHFAALKLQPRGLKFRDTIEEFVSATQALKGMDMTVGAAVASFVDASRLLKVYDVSVEQAVFEWAELKKQIGERPLYDLLKPYLQSKAAAEATEAESLPLPTEEPPAAG